MGKTHRRKDCPNIYALMTLFHFYLAGKFVLSSPQKAFFLFFFYNLTCSGSRIPLLQGYSLEKSSIIIIQSIWTLHGL